MHLDRIDLLAQYIVAIAGEEEDPFDRTLGPIHVLKYIYLADLAYAERHAGETYTGVNWRFWHFGPWSAEALDRIEPAVVSAGAQVHRIASDEAGEFVRYQLDGERLIPSLELKLPGHACSAVRRYVRKYKKDTPALLDFVYHTKPILRAAPGDLLRFEPLNELAPTTMPATAPISRKEEKRRAEATKALKERAATQLAARVAERKARAARAAVTQPEPRYDDVYQEGVAWLDSLAGPPIEAQKGTLEFSEEIWRSTARGGEDGSD